MAKPKGYIKIFQKGGHKDYHPLLLDACRFYLGQLLSTRMINTLQIRLEMRIGGRSKGARGTVFHANDGSEATKEYPVNIDRDAPLEQQLVTIAHECIHIKEIAMGEFQVRQWKTDNQVHARWKGKELGPINHIPYSERPWEIEARVNAKQLAQHFPGYWGWRRYLRWKETGQNKTPSGRDKIFQFAEVL